MTPPENGISLLDTKNDIFLSYLQALALRNLNVIRSLRDGSNAEESQELSDTLTAKLVENRVYLERGVRPLEQKIKYQVDKVVKAADEEARVAAQSSERQKEWRQRPQADDEDSDADSDDSEDEAAATSYQPKLAGFGKQNDDPSHQDRQSKSKEDGVYRPPRISATSMPTTEQRVPKERRQSRSRTLDEYVQDELSYAPLAQPSIGSTIAAGGRSNKDSRQLAREQERKDYEETHLVRLPPESKKERAKQKAREKKGGFGGEEWRGLGDSANRIGDLTKRKNDSALERSRKRRAVEDGPRNDGTGIGDAFDVKKRRMMKKARR